MSRVYENVVCAYCGCLCDDIRVAVEDNRITKAEKACALGVSKFMNYHKERLTRPVIRKNGKPVEVDVDEAVERSAEILADAKYPLLYGWSSTSNEAIRAGLELAEEVGGVYDNTSSTCHGPTILGIHDIGASTCTLGDIKNRADVIVYWGANPVEAHPRHLTRYTLRPEGFFRKRREDRTLIVVDARKTATARLADRFLQVRPGSDFEVLTTLRMLVLDGEIDQEEVAGIPVAELEEIAEILISCEFCALFFGLGLTMSRGKSKNIDAALSLIRDLNRRTKAVIMANRGHGNVSGANVVSTWTTGYPFAVDFSRGYPAYNPGDTSAVDILRRDDADATLVVASDPVSNFPRAVVGNLVKNPLIAIDPHRTPTTAMADIAIPSAFVGIEAPGTAYRMDGIPIPLYKLVEPPRGVLSDEEIMRRITAQVRRLSGRRGSP